MPAHVNKESSIQNDVEPDSPQPGTASTNVVVHANCLEAMRTLPDKYADHTISDPPYSGHVHKNMIHIGNRVDEGFRGRHTTELEFDPLTVDTMVEYATEIIRVTKGWVILFCAAEQVTDWKRALEYAGAAWKRACIWYKPDAQPQLTGDRPGQGFENICAAYATIGRSKWNAGGKLGVYKCPIPRGEKRTHPTEKPIGLMKQLIEDFTQPGELILDPFSGTGSTHVAAIQKQRRSIGYEINPQYVEIANLRIAGKWFADQRQVTIFDMLDGRKPIQQKLLAEEKIEALVAEAEATPALVNEPAERSEAQQPERSEESNAVPGRAREATTDEPSPVNTPTEVEGQDGKTQDDFWA